MCALHRTGRPARPVGLDDLGPLVGLDHQVEAPAGEAEIAVTGGGRQPVSSENGARRRQVECRGAVASGERGGHPRGSRHMRHTGPGHSLRRPSTDQLPARSASTVTNTRLSGAFSVVRSVGGVLSGDLADVPTQLPRPACRHVHDALGMFEVARELGRGQVTRVRPDAPLEHAPLAFPPACQDDDQQVGCREEVDIRPDLRSIGLVERRGEQMDRALREPVVEHQHLVLGRRRREEAVAAAQVDEPVEDVCPRAEREPPPEL